MKHFLITFLWIITVTFSFQSRAQSEIDSLKQILLSTNSDSLADVAAIDLKQRYYKKTFLEAEQLVLEDIDVAFKTANKKRIFLAKLNYANILAYFKKNREALRVYNELEQLLPSLNYAPLMVRYYLDTAWFNQENDNLPEALRSYKMAEEQLFEVSNILLKIDVYRKLGDLYYALADFDRSLTYMELSISGLNQLSDSIGYKRTHLISQWNTKGLIYAQMQNFDFGIAAYDSCYFYAQRFNKPFWMALANGNKANILTQQGKYSEAIVYLKEDAKQSIASKEWASGFLALVEVARNEIKLNNQDQARIWLDSAAVLQSKMNQNPVFIKEIYRANSEYYYTTGEYKNAYENFILYSHLRDSITKASQRVDVERVENSIELEEQKGEIKFLESVRNAQDAELKSKNRIFLTTLIGTIIILGLLLALFLVFRKQKRDNQLLQQIKEEMEGQNAELAIQTDIVKAQNSTIQKNNSNLEKEVENRTKDLQQAYSELDTFLYRASHDFRSPITTILGLNSLIEFQSKNREIRQISGHIFTAVYNMDRMLHKLQDMYEMNQPLGLKKRINIQKILDNVLEEHAKMIIRKGVEVEIKVKEEDYFHTHPQLFSVIVSNLLENAIEYQKKEVLEKFVELTIWHEGTQVKLEVKDNGIGMQDKIKEHIYQPFFRGTEQSGGNGLGLYLADKAAKKLGYTISFKTELDKGTTFTVLMLDDVE